MERKGSVLVTARNGPQLGWICWESHGAKSVSSQRMDEGNSTEGLLPPVMQEEVSSRFRYPLGSL